MFLDIAILITSTFAFVVWIAVLILYSREIKQLKEENKDLKAKFERERFQKTMTVAIHEAVQFLQENNVEPEFNGEYSKQQLQEALITKYNISQTEVKNNGTSAL